MLFNSKKLKAVANLPGIFKKCLTIRCTQYRLKMFKDNGFWAEFPCKYKKNVCRNTGRIMP